MNRRERDSVTVNGVTYRVAMCFYGEARNTTQTHHIEIDAGGNEDDSEIRIACGLDPIGTEDSFKTLREFFDRDYGICKRCLKSTAAKALRPVVEPQIAAYRDALRAKNLARDMDTMHDNASLENRRIDAKKAAREVVAAVGLTPVQIEALENAVHLCGTIKS